MRVYLAPWVFDGTGRPPVKDGAVLVGDDGRIAAAGPAAEVDAAGAERISCRGTLLPGLVDSHVHLCLSGEADPRGEILGEHPARTTVKALRALAAHLAAGVTTVRDLGGVHGIALEVGRMVEAGEAVGPRVVAAGHALCMTGGHGAFIGREVDGPWAAARAAREERAAGARCLKVVATGGMMTPGTTPGAPQLRLEEMAAVVTEARRAGLRVAAHAQGTEGILEALQAGVHTIEHGIWIDEVAAERFLETGAALVPTFNAVKGILSGRGRGVPDSVVEKMAAAAEAHARSFGRAVAHGVPIAAGTDAGTNLNRHGELAGEIGTMIERGLPVLAALRAATGGAADALGLGEVGVLAPGRLADLLEVDGDVVSDPAALARPLRVVQGGREVDLARVRALAAR